MKAFGWIWAYEAMIEQHPSMPCIFDNYMYHFRTPIDSNGAFPCHFGLDEETPEQTSSVTGTLTMKVATFNVLTLGTNGDHKFGTGSCGRHLSLLQQCHEAGLHIVGVQETRNKRVTCKNNPWYHIIHAPCRSDGHYGIQIWLHRSLQFCSEIRSFAEDDYRIVWSTYNVLAVRLLYTQPFVASSLRPVPLHRTSLPWSCKRFGQTSPSRYSKSFPDGRSYFYVIQTLTLVLAPPPRFQTVARSLRIRLGRSSMDGYLQMIFGFRQRGNMYRKEIITHTLLLQEVITIAWTLLGFH